MEYKIEDLSLVEKQVTIQVPGKEVNVVIETILTQKWQVPDKAAFHDKNISDIPVFKEHKEEILSQAAQQIFMVKVKEIRELYGIIPFNRLQIQSEAPLEAGKDFRFGFVAEVIPDLEIPELEDQKINIKSAVVTENDIDRIINSLREQLSTLEEITENRLATNGDVATFDFESQGEFKKIMGMNGTDHKLELGTQQTIEDFENIIKSLKPGETGTDTVSYPSDFPNPILAGKSVETRITLKSLHHKILPEIDDKMAQKVTKTSSVTEMRNVLRQRHHQRLTHLHKQETQRHLLDSLAQKTDVPLSPTYVASNLEDMIDQFTMAMQQRGMTTTEISKLTDEKRQQFLPGAEAAAKRQLLLLSIAKKERLKLETQEVEREISRQAQAAETDANQFMLDAQQTGVMRSIKDDLMMRKVMNLLYNKAEKTVV